MGNIVQQAALENGWKVFCEDNCIEVNSLDSDKVILFITDGEIELQVFSFSFDNPWDPVVEGSFKFISIEDAIQAFKVWECYAKHTAKAGLKSVIEEVI